MTDDGYALDRVSPARYVASELDRVAPAALSLAELAAGYMHPNPGDLARVRQNEHADDPVAWLIRQALAALARNGEHGRVQVEQDGDSYRLADGISFGDIRFERRQLAQLHDDHAALRDPFNPMSGQWADDIRHALSKSKDSKEGLRESMQAFGWVPELPAIQDERGVVLVGHRRLAVAAELGIDPVIKVVTFGSGDEADARRFRLAIASNLNAKPFTIEERKSIAEYLYGEREWTMDRIGQALNVSKKTISKDLSGSIVTRGNNSTAKDGTTRGRPKAPRKPPGSPKEGEHAKSRRTALEVGRLSDPDYVTRRMQEEVKPEVLQQVAQNLAPVPPVSAAEPMPVPSPPAPAPVPAPDPPRLVSVPVFSSATEPRICSGPGSGGAHEGPFETVIICRCCGQEVCPA